MTQVPGYIYTFPVTVLNFPGGGFPTPSTGVLRFESVIPNPAFSYQIDYVETSGFFEGELTFIEIFGPPVRLLLDGEPFENQEAYLSRFTGTDGPFGFVDVIGLLADDGTDETDVLIRLAGDPLPDFNTSQDIIAFFGDLDFVGAVPPGSPFAPGEMIQFAQIPDGIFTEEMIDPIDGFGQGPGFQLNPLPHDPLVDVIAEEGAADGNAAMEALLFRLLGAPPAGATVSDVSYIGALAAAAWFDDFTIEALEPGKTDFLFGQGIMLSTGAMPNDRNTTPSFTIDHNTPGDDQLTQTALEAFPFAGTTNDAAIIEFTIDVTDPGIDGLRLGLVFGSEEYPEFADSSFVDIAAVYVNGVNVALFNNDPTTPLSVTQRNIDAGNFIDNNQPWPDDDDHWDDWDEDDWDDHDFPMGEPAHYAVEWDGFSRQLSVRAPLVEGTNSIRIGIADTGDFALDSALFINQMQLTSGGGTVSGVLNTLDATGGGTVQASTLQEEVLIGQAPVVVTGNPEALNNDVFINFKPTDQVEMKETQFGMEQVQIDGGSAILRIDTDGDGSADTTLTFAGDFSNRLFEATSNGDSTVLTAAETGLATVSGTVRDASGTVISGAELRAVMAGAVPRSALSEDGSFSFELPDAANAPVQISGLLEFTAGSGPTIGISSAINVLRLALGIDQPAGAEAFIAADVDGNGVVGISDAIEVLRFALGLDSGFAPRWVFLDADADLSGIDRSSVSYEEGISLAGISGPIQDLDLTAVLIGHV